MDVSSDSSDLEHVHKIGIKRQLHRKIDGLQIEVFEREAIEQHVSVQQLFTSDVDCVLRQVKGITQRDVAGRELDLRSKCFFRVRGQHNRSMPINPQFQLTQKPRVLVKESDIGSSRRSDISSDTGRQECLPVDQCQVIYLARFQRLVRQSRLKMVRLHWLQGLNQFFRHQATTRV